MAKLAAVRHVYCQKCGRVSHYVTESMDPRYPLIRCEWQTAKNEPRGCGRQLGTRSADAAFALVRVRLVNEATARHVVTTSAVKSHHKRAEDAELCTICHPA